MIIRRHQHVRNLHTFLTQYPVVAILGPRQVGKTTLAHQLVADQLDPVTFFDLENPRDLTRLDDPLLALESLQGLVVLDEIQRRPELFSALRVLADRRPLPAHFLVLGSASPDLLRQSSESLAGRIHYYDLGGFSLDEVGIVSAEQLWVRGGFPASFLASTDAASDTWRQNFIQTFLERDLPQLGVRVPAITLYRFWTMLAHYHGQIWNGSELARAFGVGHTTVRRYLDTLTSALVIRQLQPWFANVGKRQVKAPKVYLSDSGLLHSLLDLRTLEDIAKHPKVGASWEGFAMEEVIRHLGVRPRQCFFWATHAGAELDLLVVRGNRRLGFEFKHTAAPRITRSMRVALADLHLERLDIVYAGEETFPLSHTIRAVGIQRILVDLETLADA